MTRFVTIVLILLALGGCGASSALNFTPVTQESRIGVLMLIDSSPVYRKFGITVFGNKSADDLSTTDFRTPLAKEIQTRLEGSGHEVVMLEAPTVMMTKRNSLLGYTSNQFSKAVAGPVDSLARENGVDYVVVVAPNWQSIDPGTNLWTEGYGIVSFSKQAWVLDHILAHTYSVQSGRVMGSFREPNLIQRDRDKEAGVKRGGGVKGFFLGDKKYLNYFEITDTVDLKNLTAQELDKAAETGVDRFLEALDIYFKELGLAPLAVDAGIAAPEAE